MTQIYKCDLCGALSDNVEFHAADKESAMEYCLTNNAKMVIEIDSDLCWSCYEDTEALLNSITEAGGKQ